MCKDVLWMASSRDRSGILAKALWPPIQTHTFEPKSHSSYQREPASFHWCSYAHLFCIVELSSGKICILVQKLRISWSAFLARSLWYLIKVKELRNSFALGSRYDYGNRKGIESVQIHILSNGQELLSRTSIYDDIWRAPKTFTMDNYLMIPNTCIWIPKNVDASQKRNQQVW